MRWHEEINVDQGKCRHRQPNWMRWVRGRSLSRAKLNVVPQGEDHINSPDMNVLGSKLTIYFDVSGLCYSTWL
jgi:hypothetical protein